MTLGRDKFFLTFRFIFINLFAFGILHLVNLFLIKLTSYNFDLTNILALIIIFLIQFLMIHTIELKNESLILKNIYGIKIKQIKRESIKGRRTKYIPNYKNLLLRRKYDRFIKIKYDLNNSTYSINGQILSKKGLKILLLKTKK